MNRPITLTPVQREVLQELRRGAILRHHIVQDEYELSGRPFWPWKKSTVLGLLREGLVAEDGRENATQRECHMRTIGLTEKGRKLLEEEKGDLTP